MVEPQSDPRDSCSRILMCVTVARPGSIQDTIIKQDDLKSVVLLSIGVAGGRRRQEIRRPGAVGNHSCIDHPTVILLLSERCNIQ